MPVIAPSGFAMSTTCTSPFSFTASRCVPAPTGDPLNGPVSRSFHPMPPVFVSAVVMTPAPLMLKMQADVKRFSRLDTRGFRDKIDAQRILCGQADRNPETQEQGDEERESHWCRRLA